MRRMNESLSARFNRFFEFLREVAWNTLFGYAVIIALWMLLLSGLETIRAGIQFITGQS